jgi:hypothetical protein
MLTLCQEEAAARAVIGPLTTSFRAIRFVCKRSKEKHVIVVFLFAVESPLKRGRYWVYSMTTSILEV